MPKGDHWNAAKCIQGEPSALQLEPDHDLGRTTRKDCQNKVRCPADEQRQFGCPTVRTDIPQRKMKSVADHQNYGDEPEVVDVLFPATYTEFNVHENDF